MTKPKKKVTFHSPVITEVSPEPEFPSTSYYNSDLDSISAEVGTDEELDKELNEPAAAAERKMATTDSADASPEWTRNEDRTICVMKLEEKSWAEIGKKLDRGKKECQQRYRAISSHAKELGITTENLAKLYLDEDKENTKTKKSNKGKGRSNSREDKSRKPGVKEKDHSSTRDKKKDQGKGKDSKEKSTKSKGDDTKSDSKTKVNSKSRPKGKNKKKKVSPKRAVNTPSSSSSSSSCCSSSSSSSSDSDADADDEEEGPDPIAEYWAQRRYHFDSMLGDLYPNQKVLRPDRFYSESDCRVLAGLEARYRANKWLHIQADFCNATGRMVEAELLQAKFYEDEG
ncbi:hypothetical protein F5Y19DRAFT_489657 [Xylariaceae sp. FL1651]|nr:hypothetical protein F5Y19DRAFT_489657 [Xylariaceae sp. FL1651]